MSLLKKIKSKLFNSASQKPAHIPVQLFSHNVREEFRGIFANEGLQTLIDCFDFKTVLDIGSGAGVHATLLEKHGKDVTEMDFGTSIYYQEKSEKRKAIIGDYLNYSFDVQFDCIWASHVLEHQPNPNIFLKKIHSDLREDGVLALTVPPLKHEIVGGHLSLWNAGLLMYHLIFAGFDCREAHILCYGYNISIILKKRSIFLPKLDYDSGDIDRLGNYFPSGCKERFDGNIQRLNWPSGTTV